MYSKYSKDVQCENVLISAIEYVLKLMQVLYCMYIHTYYTGILYVYVYTYVLYRYYIYCMYFMYTVCAVDSECIVYHWHIAYIYTAAEHVV